MALVVGLGGLTTVPTAAAADDTATLAGLFATVTHGRLGFVDPVSGDSSTELTDVLAPVFWAPDGQRLITVVPRSTSDAAPVVRIFRDMTLSEHADLPLPDGQLPRSAIWLSGGRVAVIATDGDVWVGRDDGTEWNVAFDVSAPSSWHLQDSNGSKLLFAAFGSADDGIYVLDVDAGSVQRVHGTEGGGHISGATFSPAGDRIAYVELFNVRVMDADGQNDSLLVGQNGETDPLPTSVSWSSDGREIAYDTTLAYRIVDVASGERRDVPATMGGSPSLSDWQPERPCTVRGTDGADVLGGTPGDDIICAGAGDDVVRASSGHDVVFGGLGDDRVDYSESDGPVVFDRESLSAVSAGTSVVRSIEGAVGSPDDDVLRGGSSDEFLDGGPGDDILHPGRGGSDALIGGDGNDTVSLELGPAGLPAVQFTDSPVGIDLAAGTISSSGHPTPTDDTLAEIENVDAPTIGWLKGDDGPNRLESGPNALYEGRGGDDVLVGGGIASYASADGPMTIDVPTGTTSGPDGHDTWGGFFSVIGSAFADDITSDGEVWAGAGNDVIHTTLDRPYVDGGPGRDEIDFSARTTRINATYDPYAYLGTTAVEVFRLTRYDDHFGLGLDTTGLTVLAGAGRDTINDGRGDDVIRGGSGSDTITISGGDDVADGGSGNDSLAFPWRFPGVRVDLREGYARGTASGDDQVRAIERVTGTSTHDVLLGSDRRDVLEGWGGADVLRGRGGDDVLLARDLVVDHLYGGPGRDRCVVDANDVRRSCP